MSPALLPDEKIIHTASVSTIARINAIILLISVMAFGKISNLAATSLTVTNKRVMGRGGIWQRKSLNLPYEQIAYVRVKQGWLGKLLHYGSLSIFARDGGKAVFKGLHDPLYIKYLIDEAVEVSILGHTLSEYTAEKF